MYAYLNGIEEDHSSKFYYSSTKPTKEHTTKLNLLAMEASRQALGENDILIFLNGDAFPIAQLDVFIEAALSSQPLVAIQRLENLCDPQPHPCFCATTLAFWQSIDGDWDQGHQWRNEAGEFVTDADTQFSLQSLIDRTLFSAVHSNSNDHSRICEWHLG